MNSEWLVIEIRTPSAAVDPVSALLSEFGCSGTVVEETRLDTFVPPAPDLDPDAVYQLKAYFEDQAQPDDLVARIRRALAELTALNPSWSFSVAEASTVRQEDWAEDWKQHFSTFRIGEHLIIKPTWETITPGPGDRVIEIDPGMAFGTGTHSTTLLCLETITELLEGHSPPTSLLDVGTGSGILAIGAAALGCPRILACDIDAEACRVARHNAAHNGYSQQVEVTDRTIEQLTGQFDLVVANILAEENVRLGEQLLAHLAPGGHLILSGILREKEEFVRQGFARFLLEEFPTRYHEDWICLVFRKRAE